MRSLLPMPIYLGRIEQRDPQGEGALHDVTRGARRVAVPVAPLAYPNCHVPRPIRLVRPIPSISRFHAPHGTDRPPPGREQIRVVDYACPPGSSPRRIVVGPGHLYVKVQSTTA